jgi:trk system potassium uptake protein TrkA
MMGVDLPVSATRIIASAIENDSALVKEMTMLTMRDGEMRLVKFTVDEACPILGRPLREIPMPDQARVSIIEHLNESCIPRGETVIASGDHVYVIMKAAAEEATRQLFLGAKTPAIRAREKANRLVA